jgi:hypothetical protein
MSTRQLTKVFWFFFSKKNVLALLLLSAAAAPPWQSIQTLHIRMTVTAGGRTGQVDRWEDVAAGRYLTSGVWPTHQSQDGFDGVTPWHLGRSGIAYTLGDVDAALVAADEAFRVRRGWWFPERQQATTHPAGTRVVAGRTYDVLDITPEGGRAFTALFDHDTHELARTEEQQAEDLVVTSYGDYRPVHGIQLPFEIRTGDGENPEFDEVAHVTAVDVNPAVPDSLFSIPPRPPSDISFPPGENHVEIPFRLTADNRILVPLTLEGRATVEAEFDSGGSLIVQPGEAAKLGISTFGDLKQSGGGEGFTHAKDGHLAAIAIGRATIHNIAFHSTGFDPNNPSRALIGLETLQRFTIRFDFDRQVMSLTRPDSFDYHGHGAIVPFHFQDNEPEIKASIDGIAALCPVDTGDGGSLLLIAPFARRYNLVDRYHATIPYEGRAVAKTHGVWASKRAGTVAFAGADGRPVASVHDPITRISLQTSGFDANRNVSCNIGLGILKQFNVTFDYDRQRIILEPNTLHGRPDVFNRAGLRAARDGHGWTITTVYPGSPAAAAGLREGEHIAMIDGKNNDQLTQEELFAKLIGPLGTRLVVSVEGGGEVGMVLRDWLEGR